MNPERLLSPERKKNIEMTIHLVRHEEKAKDGSLSPRGYDRAKALAPSFGFSENVKTYTSTAPRVVQTAEALHEGAEIKNLMNSRTRHELSIATLQNPKADFSPFFRDVLRKRLAEAHQEPEEVREQKIREAEARTMQEWLAFGDTQPDEETSSPEMVAGAVASHVLQQIEMADRLKSDSKVDLLNVTHEFMLAAFVKYFVQGTDQEGKPIAGEAIMRDKKSIHYLEDIKIRVKIDDKGEKKVVVEMGADTHVLRMDTLAELAEKYKASKMP